ncbi:MAG: response regulator [Chloroflexota bacterium]
MMSQPGYLFIVDDDTDSTRLLTLYFQTQGYKVEGSPWSNATFHFPQQDVPDIIMLATSTTTIQPCCEIFLKLRANPSTRRAAVMFLAEEKDSTRLDRITALEMGVDEYVIKPFNTEEFRLRVRNIINFARLQHPQLEQDKAKPTLLQKEKARHFQEAHLLTPLESSENLSPSPLALKDNTFVFAVLMQLGTLSKL